MDKEDCRCCCCCWGEGVKGVSKLECASAMEAKGCKRVKKGLCFKGLRLKARSRMDMERTTTCGGYNLRLLDS